MTEFTPGTTASIRSLARLAVYAKALRCAAQVHAIRCRETLRSQLMRAMDSVVLNIAEGACDASRAQKSRYYGIARASLFEVAAALDLVRITQRSERFDDIAAALGEIDRMLRALTRP